MADQLDRNHQRRQGGHRSEKVFQVADPGVLESLDLVVRESTKSAAQRNDGHSSRRLETRNYANQITEQNEEAQGHQERRVALAVMADDLVALALDEALDAFEGVLQCPGAVHRKARTNEKEQDQEE